ncbi:MAG: ompA-like transrane domain protein [Ramlibacter sp.]|nr:ompA-like transrane domain protein [Ramlibacter sp.]
MTTFSRTAATLGCIAAAALAGPASYGQQAGWYGGASVGRSAATIDNERITNGLATQGLSTTGIDDRDRDTGYKLYGGYQLNPYFGMQGGWFDLGTMGYTATTSPPGTLTGDVRLQGVNLDLVGSLPVTDRFSLLGTVGVAYARARGTFSSTGAVRMPYASTGTNERHADLKFGAGVAWRFTDAWEMRAEAERFRVRDSVGNRGHVDLLSVGLVYRFGGAPPAPRAMAPAPALVAVAAPAPPPQAAPMVAVPPPPAPRPLPAPVTVHFAADALFGFDQSTLRPEGMRALDAFANDMRSVQYDSVKVVGHTDRLGASDYNDRLSRRRADAVAAYLASTGLPASRLASSGAGESQPVTAAADCKGTAPTPSLIACLQPDRRVDVHVDGMRPAAS